MRHRLALRAEPLRNEASVADMPVLRSPHDLGDELVVDFDGVVHRVSRLANMFPLTHCMDIRKPALRHDAQPAPEAPTCFWCITSRYRE